MMIVTTLPSKGVRYRKRKREAEELNSPSTDAVSEKNRRETTQVILAPWKTEAYKSSSEPRKLTEVVKEMEASTCLATEEDFRTQKASMKRGSTGGQTGEIDAGKEWLSSEHQAIGKQVTSDSLEKNATVECPAGGVSRKRRNWATRQKA